MSILGRARALLGCKSLQRSSPYCTSSTSQRSLYRKFNVQVGASLQLNLSQVDADVNVCTGDNLEQIEIKAFCKHDTNVAAAFSAITQQNNRVCVDLQNVETKSFLEKLEVVMPGRWCNLFMEAGKGHVSIQNMKEANVNVTTSGGGVTFGEVRGNEAFINSNGGFVRAALITAALELKTDGGVLSLGKAVGTSMKIDTGGGDMVIGSAYGQDTKITSGGGCVVIKHLQAQEMAHVSSNGGDVQIDGLDGNVEILTSGGDVQLQLLANAREAKIDAGSGEVTLYMLSENDVKVEQVENWECHANSSLSGLSGKNSPGCRVLVSGSGKVTTMKRSWFEAVMQAQSTASKAV